MSHYQASDPDAYGYVLTKRGQSMLNRALKKESEQQMRSNYRQAWRYVRMYHGGLIQSWSGARFSGGAWIVVRARRSLIMRTTGDPLEVNFWARRGIYAKLLDERWE